MSIQALQQIRDSLAAAHKRIAELEDAIKAMERAMSESRRTYKPNPEPKKQ